MPDPQRFLAELANWAASRDVVVAVALVGSYARGEARPDSDVDVVISTNDPRRCLDNGAAGRHAFGWERAAVSGLGAGTRCIAGLQRG